MRACNSRLASAGRPTYLTCSFFLLLHTNYTSPHRDSSSSSDGVASAPKTALDPCTTLPFGTEISLYAYIQGKFCAKSALYVHIQRQLRAKTKLYAYVQVSLGVDSCLYACIYARIRFGISFYAYILATFQASAAFYVYINTSRRALAALYACIEATFGIKCSLVHCPSEKNKRGANVFNRWWSSFGQKLLLLGS